MTIEFNKVGKNYESEFEITDVCNIHLEFETVARIIVEQKTSGTQYDNVETTNKLVGKCIDVDIQALVYPKTIKVVTSALPTFGKVTYNS